MNQTRDQLSNIWKPFQSTLFPALQQEVGALTSKQQPRIGVIEFAQVEHHLPEFSGYIGRPTSGQVSIVWRTITWLFSEFKNGS